ncbi:DUF456 domain-containing protein [Adhaeretor mobilis]|uniref:DUF456 domain-containing protein n=1 Tax=Adhaeretor mobilis TaxID=1930276 RepID=A0A517N345_9BACT|nr:DUF456 domain-containing protein [Adhaeretor mobilis]QDT01553.1 hypothetical protein HG15A2_49000 [Adhaeretor mobilis]
MQAMQAMQAILPYLAAILLVLAAIGGWVLALVGMPGTWLMVAAAALYGWLGPEAGVMALSWAGVALLAAEAVAGEAAETLTGMWSTKRAGGSRRASWFALVGSLAGAIGGAGLGIPIPVIGSLVGAVLGGACGALGGATLAELTRGETSQQSLRVGRAAFTGRMLGTGAKALFATVMLITVLVSLMW